MTLEKACSYTAFSLPRVGIEPGTSSTRDKCLTTKLPRFYFKQILVKDLSKGSTDLCGIRRRNRDFGIGYQNPIMSNMPNNDVNV